MMPPFTSVPDPNATIIERHIKDIHQKHPNLDNIQIAYKVQQQTQELSPATGGFIIAASAVERVLAGKRI